MKVPPKWIPARLTLQNYVMIFQRVAIVRWFFNTLVVSTASILIRLFCMILAGYAFSMYQFPGKQFIYWLYVSSLMIPAQALLIPRFILMRNLHLIDTWWSLIFIGAFNVVHMIYIKHFLDGIPSAISDSARIDGAGELRIIWSIMLPLSKPIVGYIILMGYIASFQDFLWPFLMIQRDSMKTLCVGIIQMIKQATSQYSIMRPLGISLAGSTILFVPILIVFLSFQEVFRQRFIAGGIKG